MKVRGMHRLFMLLVIVSLAVMSLPLSSSAAPTARLSASSSPATVAQPVSGVDDLPTGIIKEGKRLQQEQEDDPYTRDDWFYSFRTAGSPDFTVAQAAALRAQAATQVGVQKQQKQQGPAPSAFGGSWTSVGPDPMVLVSRSESIFEAMAGRIGALAIRSSEPYTMYLGGAQGGMWVSSTLTSGWTPLTDQLPSLAIGAVVLAPSNEDIVYVGTGEGALSGDSYYGNGILKSTDGGNTFAQVSGDTFNQVSMSKMVVDPTNPDHVYTAVLRGRGGARRTSPPNPTPFGIWESTDGGVTWTGSYTTTNAQEGATDLVMDPANPNVLYASFWTVGIKKTTDGGLTWSDAMNGLPAGADYVSGLTRFSLGLSHPDGAASATLYTGFEWYDSAGHYHPSTVWKSTDDGGSWSETNTAVVGGFCGTSPGSTQCFYDNVMGVDPTNADIVYALGLFNYGTGTGGIYRSMDGGTTWVDLGWNQHPDFHAFAVRRDAPQNIVIGNDGGVWSSSNYGGRLSPSDPPSAVEWNNLNGGIDPNTAGTTARFGLSIGQFTSVAQHPTNVNRFYGGTQDNGTLRKSSVGNTWFDYASGDGGQVLVDPNDPNYVYGTYYGISPYRFSDGMLGAFFSNQAIYNGINRSDRSEFYIPMAMDPEYTTRLYLGTYRVYRTDNRGDLWQPISDDLTAGCSGSAPNGGRGCVITAFGTTAGGPDLYSGSMMGYIYVTTNAYDAAPTWTRVDKAPLPERPVTSFAVDRSNYRTAYVSYASFDGSTPATPGHVFKTTDGGTTWTDISGNLPDIPVNSLILDASEPNTLYAGTDVGPMVTYDGGATWSPMGDGFPIVTIWQLNENVGTRQIIAGTHGRGVWKLTDGTNPMAALQVRTSDDGSPVGPGTLLTYTITIKNIGNAGATGVSLSDPIPAHTTFVSADNGGSLSGNDVMWSGLAVDPLSSVAVHLTVRIDQTGVATGSIITNDGIVVASDQGVGASGSPHEVTLAPAFGLAVTPASQFDGARSGRVVSFTVQIHNLGYTADQFDLGVSGNTWPTTLWDAQFNNQISETGVIPGGGSAAIGVRVEIPAQAANGARDTATVAVTSSGDPSISMSATVESEAVTLDVLLVDEDGGAPNVESYYENALAGAGYQYNYWDLATESNLPVGFLKAHKSVVWFTGTSYPGPLLPYESELASFLDGGGRLFVSGQDVLDQSAGTTAFVYDYLHIDWDGSERQNDIGTTAVTAVMSNTVTNGLGTVPLDFSILGGVDFSDEITPVDPAVPAFWDDLGKADALTVSAGNYKVMFLAFPFEVMGSDGNRQALMARALHYFMPPLNPYQAVLQNGLNGYSGAADTTISSWAPTTNYGSDPDLTVRQPNEKNVLLRFDLTGLPMEAQITTARIGLWVTYVSSSIHNYAPLTLKAYELYKWWTPADATWMMADATTAWETPGAMGPSDRGMDPVSQVQGYNRTGRWMWFNLPNSLVQEWIGNPAGNNGVVIAADGRVNGEIQYISSDFPDSGVRPQLKLTYMAP